MRLTPRRRILVVFLAVAAVLAAWLLSWRPLRVEGKPPADGYVRIRGALHVHTVASGDAGGTVEDVVAAARTNGLDFVVVTDHNTIANKTAEGWHDGALVVVGEEASTIQGHVVAVGIPAPTFRFSGDARDVMDDVQALGGFALAAHPTSPRADLRYLAWDVPGPWGLEVVNADSQFRGAGKLRDLATALAYPLNPRRALLFGLAPVDDALARWDGILAQRPAPGWAGADAHQRLAITKKRSLPVPSYAAALGMFQDHLLLDRPLTHAAQDTVTITDALGRGRGYVGIDGIADASGFTFTAEGGGRRATMGDTVAPEPAPVLRAGGRLPKGALVRLLRDGRVLQEAAGGVEVNAPGPGVYRVEVHLAGWPLPWVISNPIYVFAADAAAARAARAAWPDPPPVPAARTPLDDRRAESTFAAEFDPASSMEKDVHLRGAAPSDASSLRLQFRLGPVAPDHPYVSCALSSRAARDLTGYQGLVFAVKSDRTYRMWVQVRDANPASADEGTEWWFASVRTEPEWRRVAVPFASLRSLNVKSDGRLDLERVKGIVFLVDAGAEDPGTAGTIDIRELGLY